MTALALASLLLALVPALLAARNLRLYRPPDAPGGAARPRVSVLVPARDEEANIAECLRAAVAASEDTDAEFVVLDDHSRDATARIVQELVVRDPRIRLERAPALPAGWTGKMHALQALGMRARGPLLVFVDADVRLAPGALARMAAFLERSGADLASGFPRQRTGTWLERAAIPLMHFVLLGFLPLDGMRRSRSSAFAAGCGQLFVARKAAWERAGGHAAVRDTLHDGLALPRAFRAAGLRTDLFDASALAACRMYEGARATWRGLHKNAHQGMGSPGALGPFTVLLAGGQVLPALLAPICLFGWAAGLVPAAAAVAAGTALALSLGTRAVLDARFGHDRAGTLLHPAGVAVLLAAQWYAAVRHRLGAPATWRGRAYPAGPGQPAV